MQRNRKFSGLITLLALTSGITAATGLITFQRSTIIRVKHVLDQPGFPEVRVAGVCDITADGATCWDTSGKPFESLGTRITAYYLNQGYADLSIRPGSKNRWVAIEREENPESLEWICTGIENGYSRGTVNGWRQRRSLEWSRMDLIPEDKVASIQVSFMKFLPSVDLPLKKGAIAELQKERLTLSDFGRLNSSSTLHSFGDFRRKYRILLRREHKSVADGGHLYVQPMDSKGKRITQVDDRGKPVQAEPGRMNGSFSAELSSFKYSATEIEYATNIDPRFITKLQFEQRVSQQVVFQDLPADPIPHTK